MAPSTIAKVAFLLAGSASLATAQEAVLLHGSGTTNPSKFFWQIMDIFKASTRKELQMSYRAVGSSTGQREFSQGSEGDYTTSLTDFGSGDIPMSSDRYAGLSGASREMVHVPFALGAIAIFHSVPVGEVGNDGLKLTPCLLAKIFNGTITTWDDAEILAENPSMDGQVPPGTKIQVGHRTHGSSSTGGLSGYLSAATATECSTAWGLGSGSTLGWPTNANFHPVEGSPGMTDHIANNQYAIGYLDAGHGHQRDFSEVKLKNADGTYLTSLEAMAAQDSFGNNGVAAAGAAGMSAGKIPADVTTDWSAVNLYNMAGEHTWPIVLVSYLYVHKDMSTWDMDRVSLLKSFIDYVTDESKGQALLATYSFNSIPSTMNLWSSSTWPNVIAKPGGYADVFTFEDSTEYWVGQGEHVISVKRNTYSMWKIGELELANQQLEERLDALENHLSEYGIVPLHGSGTTNPKNWFAKVMKQMEHRARVPLLLTYRAVGSSTGQKEFVGQESNNWQSYSHFGSGDIPMTADRYNDLFTRGHTMLHLPFALGAIGIFHSIPANELGTSGELRLDGCILASIFSGKITSWNAAEIVALNEGMSVAPANELIRVGHRTLGSSSTGGVSGYLDKKCSSQWGLGASSTIAWPTTAGFQPVQGSQGMQSFLDETSHAIGYLDAGHGHDFGLSEVALTNKAGRVRTSKQALELTPSGVEEAGSQAVANNVFPTSATADWSAVNLYDMDGSNTWPIVLVSYIYVKVDQTSVNPRTAAALEAFLDLVLTNAGDIAQEFKFTPPSASLRSLALAAKEQIVFPASMESFTFEDGTLAYDGMGINVISGKRVAFDDYERSVLFQELEALQARTTQLEMMAATTTVTTSGTTATAGTTMGPTTLEPIYNYIEGDTTEESSDTGTIALILAIVATVVATVALAMGCFAFMKIPKARETGLSGGGMPIGHGIM
mmetsp:Transcript_52905/g.123832  ORF Transcript_52905/g.123832 Transcript_52905/m.123832 type:complete len:948 (-) Transcript_52905:90-2933(-)